ncbi:MAG TPA: cytochrome c biogenesis protein CcdA [Solirubrobacteraceae bacterium]|nr:cytochrome c biogenesis protein CcdA [Solirubrobacteraceae bacterium]
MLILLLFALIAGAGTAITPCVLPVLPALLSASALGGRRRPLGIVTGLAIAFTVAIVALAQLVRGVGLASGAARDLAVAVLILFGVALIVPELGQRIQAPLSRLARFGPRSRGDGFVSGLGVGAALGFVCAPCAGPILAAVTTVSASSGPTPQIVVTALAYAIGLSAVLLVYAFGGRALLGRVRRVARGHVVERALGIVLLATGIAMAFNLDARLDQFIARHESSLPAVLFDPTQSLENSAGVQRQLASLRPVSRFVTAARGAHVPAVDRSIPASAGIPGVRTPTLGDLGPAPDFTHTQRWFNTPGGRPESIRALRGHVVLVDFWTYTCINCIRTLPFIEGLYRRYHSAGLDIVGVETPEFTFEQNAANVAQAIRADGLSYPIVQDNDYGTWNAYNNQYWPADYLIDARGQVRHTQFGEGDYLQEEAAVRTLLYEAGDHHLPAPTTARAIIPSSAVGTPETYLNPVRYASTGAAWRQPIRPGTHAYRARAGGIALNTWALQGAWTAIQPVNTNSEGFIAPAAPGASITGGVQARNVYLVMSSADGSPGTGRVLLDGRPIAPGDAGTAVHRGGYFTVSHDTLYNLVKLPRDAQFTITVQLPAGVRAYDFTFG